MDQNASRPPVPGRDRRRFLETSGRAALAAPAVALLLAAGTKTAHARDDSTDNLRDPYRVVGDGTRV